MFPVAPGAGRWLKCRDREALDKAMPGSENDRGNSDAVSGSQLWRRRRWTLNDCPTGQRWVVELALLPDQSR